MLNNSVLVIRNTFDLEAFCDALAETYTCPDCGEDRVEENEGFWCPFCGYWQSGEIVEQDPSPEVVAQEEELREHINANHDRLVADWDKYSLDY